MSLRLKRILFVIPTISGGGAERVFSTLLDHLDRNRFEIHLALLNVQAPASREIPPDVRIHDLKCSRVRHVLPALVKLVWKIRPDALLSTVGHMNLALIASRLFLPRRTRVLVRESTIASVWLRDSTSRLWMGRWLYRCLYNRADRVVCPSSFILEDLAKNFGVSRAKLVRIYNPVDVDKVRSFANSEGSPYNGPGPHLVAVSRLSAEKGLDLLLDAMPAILQLFPDVQLTVLGEGPLLADLQDRSKKLTVAEHVHFLGFQKNPWRYVKYAHLFVLPSRFEGIPNALLEAIALETPVVATDCAGGIREVQECHQTMILVAPENASELAKGIVRACQAPPHGRQGATAVGQRLRKFDLYQVVEQYNRILTG